MDACHCLSWLQVDVKGLKDQRDALQAALGEAEALQSQVAELGARTARLPALQAEVARLAPLSDETVQLEAQLSELRQVRMPHLRGMAVVTGWFALPKLAIIL